MQKTLLVVLCSLLLSSCYSLSTQVPTDKPILLNTSAAVTGNTQPFKRIGSQGYLFWGLVGNDNQAIQNVLLEEVAKGSALQKVKIQSEFSFTDMLLGTITLGIYTPRSFTITGEIVQ